MKTVLSILMIIACYSSTTTTCLTSNEEDAGGSASTTSTPIPKPWPEQFHATTFLNLSGALQLIDLWYDWPNGRNLNIEQDQLAEVTMYNVEWTNGTSFFFAKQTDECQVWSFDVGILRPNWMVNGANYLGQRYQDGFLCNVWEKANEFIHYYEDVVSKLPVYWLLFTGKETHVMTFEVGAVLEDTKWQAPSYCFKTDAQQTATLTSTLSQAGRVRRPMNLI